MFAFGGRVVKGNEPQNCGVDVRMICVLNSYSLFFLFFFSFREPAALSGATEASEDGEVCVWGGGA